MNFILGLGVLWLTLAQLSDCSSKSALPPSASAITLALAGKPIFIHSSIKSLQISIQWKQNH